MYGVLHQIQQRFTNFAGDAARARAHVILAYHFNLRPIVTSLGPQRLRKRQHFLGQHREIDNLRRVAK